MRNFDGLITFMDKIYLEKAQIKKIKIFHKNFIFIFNYLLAKQILINKQDLFAKNEVIFNKIKPVTGDNGIVQMQGDISKEYRNCARSIFTSDTIEQNKAIISSIASDFVNKININQPLYLSDFITQMVLKTAVRMFLGLDIENIGFLGNKFLRLNELCGQRMINFFCLPLWFPTINNLEIINLRNSIRKCIAEQILPTNTQEKNVVTLFKHSDYLIDQCMTFLFAGHETTASSITFTLLLLAKYPHYQEQVYAGNDDVIKAIYKESLRLYPPAYMLVREVKHKNLFHGLELNPKDQIIIGVRQIHRCEEYFYRPQEFIPERFLGDNKHEEFLPFGIGAKSCLGERLAYLEAIIILKIICQKFRIKSYDKPIECSQLITLHPKREQVVWLEKRLKMP
jgi:cytochrome P450